MRVCVRTFLILACLLAVQSTAWAQATIAGAKLNLIYCHITAPISGRIGLRLVDPGNFVSAAAATPLLVITQTQPISVIFTIPEQALASVRAPLRAGKTLSVDAIDRNGQQILAKGKLTLPLLLAVERATPVERASLEAVVREWTPESFSSLLRILHRHRALEDSQASVHEFLGAAREKLGVLPGTKSRSGLAGLADYLAMQTDALGNAG